MKRLYLKVQGMTCSSCEVLIERNLKKVLGVENVKVSRTKEQAEVECSDTVQLQQLQDAVKEKGYALSFDKNDASSKDKKIPIVLKDKERYYEIGAVLVVLFGVYFILTQFNLLPQNIGVTDNMGYGFIFVIGLVAATSTCLAVAGGLLLVAANKYNEKHPHLTEWQKFRPHIYFNAGRIISYTILGGVVGLLGSIFGVSPKMTGIITILASLLMIIMGLQMLGIFPWLNKIQIKIPKFIAHRIYDAGHQEQKSVSKTSSFLFGAATFFLPCGFTQALQLYVLGKGSFVIGALTMLAFSLGTLPSLAGIGAFSSFAKGNFKKYFMTFSAVLIIALGIFNVNPGLNLVGAAVAVPAGDIVDDKFFNFVDGRQIIELKIDGLDYSPTKFTLKKGVPVEWRIDGSKAVGCAQIISVPKLEILEQLPKNEIKIIEFTPQQTGKIIFSCGMGMAGPGTFEVIP